MREEMVAVEIGMEGILMSVQVIDVSTEVFHLLQERGPSYVSWSEEKPGPMQKILVGDDVYTELIDRAIAHRQTLDQVVRETCKKTRSQAFSGRGRSGNARRMEEAN